MRGYKTLEALERTIEPFSKAEEDKILISLRNCQFTFVHERELSQNSAVYLSVLTKTLERLKIPSIRLKPTPGEFQEMIRNGKVSVTQERINIFTFYPAYDTKLLFSDPQDVELQRVLDQLKNRDARSFVEFNDYFFAKAERNIYSHFRNMIASKEELPRVSYWDAVTSPWLVFDY